MNPASWLRVVFCLSVIIAEIIVMAPTVSADGLPISGNHLLCAKTTLKLTLDQRQIEKGSAIILTPEQKNKLQKDAGYAPRKVKIIAPKEAKGTCTCEMVNVALLCDAGTIEVPHFLLACNKSYYDPYADKAGRPCVWGL